MIVRNISDTFLQPELVLENELAAQLIAQSVC